MRSWMICLIRSVISIRAVNIRFSVGSANGLRWLIEVIASPTVTSNLSNSSLASGKNNKSGAVIEPVTSAALVLTLVYLGRKTRRELFGHTIQSTRCLLELVMSGQSVRLPSDLFAVGNVLPPTVTRHDNNLNQTDSIGSGGEHLSNLRSKSVYH